MEQSIQNISLPGLASYAAARAALAAARRVDEVKAIRDKAEALRTYAAQAKDRDLELWAGEIRLRAERRAGGLLKEMKERGERIGHDGAKKTSRERRLVLPDLGITRDQSSRWQCLSRVPEATFEQRLLKAQTKGTPLTTADFLREKITRRNIDALFLSNSAEWHTPRRIIDRVLKVMGEIDLDPCSNAKGREANVPARVHFTKHDNGLSQTWRGRVYMNPPYGEATERWVRKLIESYCAGTVKEAVALLPARTESRWCGRLFDVGGPVCFVRGRLKFLARPGRGACFPSAAFYMGDRSGRFNDAFADIGEIRVRPARRGTL